VADLSKQQIDELAIDLKVMRDQLMQAIEDDQGQLEPVQLDQQSVGRVSRIDAIQQQEMAKALKQQQRQHLQQLIRALNELDKDDYGYCQHCGHAIAFARLKARPESEMCVKCQQNNE
jgi:DnaK suppressor protein